MTFPNYSVGTVSVAANATAVVGTGTLWQGVNARAGDLFQIGSFGALITDVTDYNHLVISKWGGGAQSAAAYTIFAISPLRYAGADAQTTVEALIKTLNGVTFYIVEGDAPDPSLGEEGQAALKINAGPWKFWLKTGGEWVYKGQPAGLAPTSNLSDLTDRAAARINLGLSSAAVRADKDFPRTDVSQTLTAAQKRQAQANIFIPKTWTVLTSGSGTYSTPAGCTSLKARLLGGGGGGGGSGQATGGTGGTGGNTTFGTSLLVATGGAGGAVGNTNPGAAGGNGSLGSGPVGFTVQGACGGSGSVALSSVGIYPPSGAGGHSALGGAGNSTVNGAGNPGIANTGGGGGGGGGSSASGMNSGSGGGGGGYVEAIINSPGATYAWAVGAGGTAGSAGTNGFSGSVGGSGIIVIEESYGS